MVKYLATLERLAPRFGTERVPVCRLQLLAQAEGEPCYIRDGGQSSPDPEPQAAPEPTTHEVLVSGTDGIQWRLVQAEVSGGPLPSGGPEQLRVADGFSPHGSLWVAHSCSALAFASEVTGLKRVFAHMALGCVCLCLGACFLESLLCLSAP